MSEPPHAADVLIPRLVLGGGTLLRTVRPSGAFQFGECRAPTACVVHWTVWRMWGDPPRELREMVGGQDRKGWAGTRRG